ncbi:MAG TPA: hypothetical protein VMU52_06945, partial [Steroidobacteraceae bacterium]|nr:hypothetical protein [Steroidobacteraceae bacterium]
LPHLPDVDSREAMNLLLEDLLDLPQVALPPEWAAELLVPRAPEIESQITAKRAEIDALNQQIVRLEKEKGDLVWCRKLLYESGTELERVFSDCLAKLGGQITPATYSQEEFVLEFEGMRSLVECKGVSKSASLAHVRQLTSYTLQYEEDEGASGRGILFVNAWRDLHPGRRESDGTPAFPPNVISAAEQRGIALLSSTEFFRAYCEFLAGRFEGAAILRRLSSSTGVVTFP